MVKDHSDSKRGNLLLPHVLLFSISSKGSFICTTDRIAHTTASFTPVVEHWLEGEIAQWDSIAECCQQLQRLLLMKSHMVFRTNILSPFSQIKTFPQPGDTLLILSSVECVNSKVVAQHAQICSLKSEIFYLYK